jgi:plasmid stabilization system protein ParE
MISSVSFHELADLELNEAAQYYESEVTGLGVAFLAEVERSIKQIQDHPEAAPAILRFIRRKLLRRFPYSIMYSVVDDSVRILAIANQKRRPFYWYRRR